MKHLRKGAVVMALMACLIGCGGKPSGMDDNTYKLGCKALEIMDDYNSMEISKDDAYDQLGDIYDRLDSREYDEDQQSESIQNDSIRSSVLGFQIGMNGNSDLVEEANNLRNKLNK
jgi:hypothetical protein